MKNNLPTGWKWKTLEDVCDKASSNISQNQLNNEIGEYPIFGASGLIKKISFYHQEKEYIGIVKDGAGVGRVTLLPKKSSVIGTLQYLIPKEDVDIKFLFYFLKGLDFTKFISGSTIPHIYFKNYKDEPFPFPPVAEQKKIVTILENAFFKIDQAIDLASCNIEKLKKLDESAFSEVFEKNRKTKIGDILTLQRGFDLPTQNRKKGNVPIIGANGIVGYHNESKIIGGGVVTGRSGSIGLVHFFEQDFWALNTSLYVKDYKGNLPKYCYYQLKANSEKIKQQATYSAVPTLDRKNVQENILTTFHSKVSKQHEIVKYLDILTESNAKLHEHYQRKLKALQRLKNSVLESAFKGEFKKEQKAKTFNLAFYQMQLIGLSVEANKYDNIPQGEMAIAKDLYLLDRLFQVPTKMNFVNHSWGPFAPEIKKGITNKTYFGKKNFPNSKATYVITQNDEALFKTVSGELKKQVFSGISELNSQLFSKISPYKRAETKELLATVLKCIEDKQSVELLDVRQAMQNWKIEQGQFKTKAEKFSEKDTLLIIKFIVKENWHFKVIKGL